MPRLLGPLLFAALLSSPAPTSAATLVLDAMSDALPPNPCLPSTQQRVVFAGPYCDGTSCPPGTIVPPEAMLPECSAAVQHGLAGVFGGARTVGVQGDLFQDDTTTVRVDTGASRLRIATRYALGSGASLVYDGGVPDWNRDLGTATEIRFEVDGSLASDRPLRLDVTLGNSGGSATVYEQLLTAPGTIVIPFSAFVPWDETFDIHAVDFLNFTFMECTDTDLGCPFPAAGLDCSIGPITIETDLVTSTTRSSWGGLKVRYR